jgi:S1-C subfamily serine protease/sugar lactone lactonase YvrE
MKRLTLTLAATALLAALAVPASAADKKKPLSAAEVFKRTTPGIVAIDCLGPNAIKIGTASGFLVSDNGKIVTNFHVIQQCASLMVRLSNGDTYDATYVNEVDPRKDLAIIRIKAASLTPLVLGESNDIEVGQTIFSIGNPNGLQNTLQQGLVSAIRPLNGYRLIQVSASINAGNSGGPILDGQARVVAIAAAKVTGAENLGFAIPIDYAKGLLDSKTEMSFTVFAAGMKEVLAKVAANKPTLIDTPGLPTGAGGGVVSNGPGNGGGIGAIRTTPVTGAAPVFNRIDAFAGRIWKFEGDGMPARKVALGRLHGVACDRAGNIYATDLANQAIVKIDTNGRLKILLGPDSPPKDRPMNPQGIFVDAAGAVFFADDGLRVRKIMPTGEVVTVAGGDRRGFTADGSPAIGASLNGVNGVVMTPDGTMLFTEWDNNRLRRVDKQGNLQTVAGDGESRFAGDGGPATQASLSRPNGVAVDADGNIFISDQFNHRVRKVSRDGTISTVLGGDNVKDPLGCPMGVAVDAKGAVYAADPCRRRVLALRSGESFVFAGNGSGRNEPSGEGGPAAAASFDEWGLATGPAGDVFVGGPDYGRVYRIAADGTFSIVAGTGLWRATADGTPARDASFQGRIHLATQADGGVIVSDSGANRIYRVYNGTVTRLAGFSRSFYNGENVPAKDAALEQPMGVRVRPNGAIVFAERGNSNRIREIAPNGNVHTLAGNGRREYSGDGGRALNASLNGPNAVCLDSSGVIYVADTENQRIRKITPDGSIQLVAGNGSKGFSGDGGPAERASFNTPTGVEVGPDGSVYVADAGNRRVRKISPTGVITTIAGDGTNRFSGDGSSAVRASFGWPYALAWGPDHALYVTDTVAGRIRRLDLTSGAVASVAGNGMRGTLGDGGAPLLASLGSAEGLAIDGAGNIYLGDSGTGVIRVVRATPGSSAVVPGGVPGGVASGPIGGVLGGILGGGNSAPPPPPPPRALPLQVGVDRMETLLRGKIGMWSEDDAKTILGAVKDQKQEAQGSSLTFDTPNTAFTRVTLRYTAGKLATVDFVPAQNVRWDAQLTFMKSKFAGDDFRIEQRGDDIAYTFPRSRTTFAVRPDGTIALMSIF